MEDTAQREIDLHKKVGESLDVSPEEVDPRHLSSLEKLKETGAEILDVAQSVGSHVSDKISEEATQIRIMESKKPSIISRIRARMKWK